MECADVKAIIILWRPIFQIKIFENNITMPIQLFDIKNNLRNYKHIHRLGLHTTNAIVDRFFNHHQKLKELLYTNSNAIILIITLSADNIDKIFLNSSYLDSLQQYLTELGAVWTQYLNTIAFILIENEESKIIGGLHMAFIVSLDGTSHPTNGISSNEYW